MDAPAVIRRLISAGFLRDAARAVLQHPRTAKAGEALPLATSRRHYFVASGWIFAQHRLPTGSYQTLQFFLPGDLIDDTTIGMPYTRLIALTSATFVQVPLEITRSPYFAALEVADMRAKALHAHQHAIRLGRLDAQQKMADFLLEIDTRWRAACATNDAAIPFPLRQNDIADYLALSPVHINRTLMALRKNELVEISRGRLTITDHTSLRRASQRRTLIVEKLPAQVEVTAH